MGVVRGWAAAVAVLGSAAAVVLGGWTGGTPARTVDWRDGRAPLIDATSGKVVIADPRAATIVASFPAPGAFEVTELDDTWLIDTNRTSADRPRQLVAVARATRQPTARRSVATAARVLTGEHTIWLLDRHGTARRLDPRTLKPAGPAVELFDETDIDSAVARADGTLAAFDARHRRVATIDTDDQRNPNPPPPPVLRLPPPATRFWATLPDRNAVTTLAGSDTAATIPTGFDLTDTAAVATEPTHDLLAVTDTTSTSPTRPTVRVAVFDTDRLAWTRTTTSNSPSNIRLALVNSEPAVIPLESKGSVTGPVRFVAPPGRGDTTIDITPSGLDTIRVDDGTLYLDNPTSPTAIAVTDHTPRTITKNPTGTPPDPTTPDPTTPDLTAPDAADTATPTPNPDGRPDPAVRNATGTRPAPRPGTSTGRTPGPGTGATPTPNPDGNPFVNPGAPPGTTPLPGPTTTITPTPQPTRPKVTAIAAGNTHTCALTNQGAVKCWGDNSFGQLGNGTTTNSTTPVDVTGLDTGVTAITAGYDHTCALLVTGRAKCWGYNRWGALGNATAGGYSMTPVEVTTIDDTLEEVDAGAGYTCVLTVAGRVSCWGDNRKNWLQGADAIIDATQVAAGPEHACALISGGTVQCWGKNYDGALGGGTAVPSFSATPVTAAGIGGVRRITTSYNRTCVLLTGGTIRCWGTDNSGGLGAGPRPRPQPGFPGAFDPVAVFGITTATQVDGGKKDTTCARLDDGAARCWGENTQGQLGNGTTTNSTVPVEVTGLGTGVAAVSTGLNHACALTANGGIKCWGGNVFGQLGNGTTADSPIPIGATGLS